MCEEEKLDENCVKIELFKIETKEASTNTDNADFKLNTNSKKVKEKKITPEKNVNEKLLKSKWIKNAKISVLAKQIITEVFSKSTMHGVARIFNSKHLLIKAMWVIFLIVCSSSFAYMAILSLLNYSMHEVTTKIRTIYERPTLFPTVTICNKNLYTTDYALMQLKNDIDSYHLPDLFNYTELVKLTFSDRKNLISGILYTFSDKIGIYSEDEKKKLGHTIDDILIECIFNNKECTQNDFVWHFDKLYGNCFKFNSGFDEYGEHPIRSVNQPGKLYGLSLTLFEKLPNALKRIVPDYGFTIKLDNNSFNVAGTDGIDLLSGVETSIAVNRIFSSQLPEPYSNCHIHNIHPKKFDSELYAMFLKSNVQYKQQYCVDLCVQKLFIDDCNCTANAFFSLYNVTNCHTNSEITCSIKTYMDKIGLPNFINENCIPLCPLECNRTEYKTSLTISQFSSEIYFDHIKNKTAFKSKFDDEEMTFSTVKEGMVKLNIYYDSLTYTEMTESVSMNAVSLLSSIGGFMGMFLGMSLMTLVEILEVFIKFLYSVIFDKKAPYPYFI